MAKIKINKLPKGFKLVDGKVVQEMNYGGMVHTGDQANYGLVTTPQEFYGETNFNNTRDEDVRYSLSAVPRDNANIEAEGGETVLTDLNNDGMFGLYNINGPRHSQGGVPMFLPEQSFIYSDTPKLRFTKEEMKEFDMGGQRKTPAQISKKFQLNDYYAELDSQYADNISSRSAELMLRKNMQDLSKLGFMQEAKKNFEDGVPLVSHPYLVQNGIDPLQFTAQVEGITEKQAAENAISQLPQDQQDQLRMLQQMLVAAEQQANQGAENTMNTPATSAMQSNLAQGDDALMQSLMAKDGLEMRDFLMKAQDGNGEQSSGTSTYQINGQIVDRATYVDYAIRNNMHRNFDGKLDQGFIDSLSPDELKLYGKAFEDVGDDWDVFEAKTNPLQGDLSISDEIFTERYSNASGSGSDEIIGVVQKNEEKINQEIQKEAPKETDKILSRYPEGSDTRKKLEELQNSGYELSVVDGRVRAYKPFESRFQEVEAGERREAEGSGTGSVPIYSEDIEGQGQVLQGSPIGQYRYGILSGGNRPENQAVTGEGSFGSVEIESDEAEADFMNRWGDVVSQIDGFDYNAGRSNPQWLEFQKLAEQTRKEEAEKFGIPYVPYFMDGDDENFVKGSGFDGDFGLHTFNTPRLDVDFSSEDEQFFDIPEEPEKPNIPGITPAPLPEKEIFAQDRNNLLAMNAIEDEMFMPFGRPLEEQKIDYVLDDYTGRVNANLAAQNTMANALGAYGPQAIARSNIQGKTLAANANAINQVNQNNVRTMNRVAALQPQIDMRIDAANNKITQDLYDNTQTTLQQNQNFRNWKTAKNNELTNTAITNASNAYNMNTLYDYYNIDPSSGGDVVFTPGGRQLYKQSQADGKQQMLNDYIDLKKNLGPDVEIDEDFLKMYMGMGSNQVMPGTTAGQNELQQRGIPGYPGSNNIMTNNQVESGELGKEKRLKKFAVPFYSGKMGS